MYDGMEHVYTYICLMITLMMHICLVWPRWCYLYFLLSIAIYCCYPLQQYLPSFLYCFLPSTWLSSMCMCED
uniref:Uncharacterized protein n=1 Tax=Arundo donax TaxID=35708 RepID=A0A0A9EI05_ARUDO